MSFQDDFPIIKNLSGAQPFVYLDSAATSLKPQSVISAVSDYYSHLGATVHRGSYKEAELATLLYENCRASVAQLINAKKHEVIFTKGTTDGLNFLAQLLEIKKSDFIINCIHEHHANFIPWSEYGSLITIDLTPQGLIDLEALEYQLKTNDIKLVSISYASNVTGNIQPIEEIASLAKKYGALVSIDGAQIIAHRAIDMARIGADFFVCSGHKCFAPTGVGILYIREERLAALPYKRFGGGMVDIYNKEHQRYKRAPEGFEPGTPAIESVIGLAKAIEYVMGIGYENIAAHLDQWSALFLQQIQGSAFYLAFPKSADSLSIFTLRPKKAALDLPYLARMLSDTYNLAVNDGQQCCGPLYFAADIKAGMRISPHIYNPLSDVDHFFHCLEALSFFTR